MSKAEWRTTATCGRVDVVSSLVEGMALRGIERILALGAAFGVAAFLAAPGSGGKAYAQTLALPSQSVTTSLKRLIPPVRPIGLWDKPNQICTKKCGTHVEKGCFKRLADKDPTADAMSIHNKCEDLYSLCLYDCMCDTCDENQIIIKKKKPPVQ